MDKDTRIRKATIQDISAIYSLVLELAEYEKSTHEVWATESDYRKDFSEGIFRALVAEVSGQIVGTAIYYTSYSTWKGKMIYLEDFIVTESERGKGIGKSLFNRFLLESRNSGAHLIRLQVLDWNKPAINFYKKYPVSFSGEWLNVKIILSELPNLT
jgi:GNAT superfamily N-acetyltransferase